MTDTPALALPKIWPLRLATLGPACARASLAAALAVVAASASVVRHQDGILAQTFARPVAAALDEGRLGRAALRLLFAFGGSATVALASALCAIAAFALVERACRRAGAAPSTTLLVLAGATLFALPALAAGESGGALLLFALGTTAGPGRAGHAVLALASFAAINAGPGGYLLTIWAMLSWVGAVLVRRRHDGALGDARVKALVAAAAALCTPHPLRAAFDAVRSFGFFAPDVQLPGFAPAAAMHGQLALAFTLAVAFAVLDLDRRALALAVGFAALAYFDLRALAYAGLAIAPFVAVACEERLRRTRTIRWASAAAAAVTMACLAWTVPMWTSLAAANAARIERIALVRAYAGDGARIACEYPIWCGDLAAIPGTSILAGDDAWRVAPGSVKTAANLAALSGDWRGALARSGANAVLAHRESALGSLLRLERGWRQSGAVGSFVLFVRQPA